MNDGRSSTIAQVFYWMAAILTVISVFGVVVSELTPVVGIGALLGSALLWWMGEVVALLNKISCKLGNETNPNLAVTTESEAANTSGTTPVGKDA